MTERSAFERALEVLTPEQVAKAYRLRDAFHLRDDDAIWLYCSIVKGLEAVLDETRAQCVAAVEEVLGEELGAPATPATGAPRRGNPPPRQSWHLIALASLSVVWVTLVGSTALVIGTLIKQGSVPWVTGVAASTNAFEYAARAVLNAPVGGFFAIVGLLSVGLAVALDWGRRRFGPPCL